MTVQKKIYECGTLKYTLSGVVLAIGLLMMGFFGMGFASNIVGMVSLRLKVLQASDMTIAFIMSTIAGIFNMTVCPAVSFKSDRYRGKRWGRRIVFIVGTLPMMCLALLGFATSGVAGEFLAGVLKPLGEFAPATIIVVLLGIMMVFWQFFYMFIGSVIYYIYSDVIPTQFLARAVGMVQVAAVAAATVVNLFLLKYANTHFSQLMVLAAIVYFLAVGAMCLFLKEPELPPLTEDELKSTLGPRGIFTFVKESFSHRFYWFNTFANSFWSVGTGCIGTFLIFFYMALGMDLETIGNLNGINGLVGMVLGMAMATAGAILIDRWHPVRVFVYSIVLQSIFVLVFGKWIFCTPGVTVIFYVMLGSLIANTVISNIGGLAGMPMLIRTMPKSRFGQFCSASAMVRALLVLVGGLLLGASIDLVRKFFDGDSYFVYRLIWVWRFIFGGLGVFFYILTYREYLRLGGELHYKAPAPWSPEKWETLDNYPSDGITRRTLKIGLYCWDGMVVLYWIISIAAYVYSRESVWLLSLPLMAATTAVWLMLRWAICRRMPVSGEKIFGGVIHHGILWIGVLQQLLLLIIGVVQTVMLFKESAAVSGRMWMFEILILAATLLILLICNFIERTKPIKSVGNE